MRFKQFVATWHGLFLALMAVIASLYLASRQQLNLYVHPRYIQFTTVISVVGLVLLILTFRLHPVVPIKKSQRVGGVRRHLLLGVASVIMLLLVKPATLTNTTASQRGVNSGVSAGITPSNAVPLFGGGDYAGFTVADWVPLLVQTNDVAFFKNKTANLTGFISPDETDPQNVFYVSRFVITCCAVDAQPIGVPVYLKRWQDQFKTNSWIQVNGGFEQNPSGSSEIKIVLKPTSIKQVTEPKDPYVY